MTDGSTAYDRIESLLSARDAVVLDGGVATELERVGGSNPAHEAKELWGTWALYQDRQAVLDVHRSYVDAGCHVISTNTWSILTASETEFRVAEVSHWMNVARLGIRLARQAIQEGGRDGECAVAFAISEEVTNPERGRTVELLTRVFEENPPDLILMETLSLVRDLTYSAVETLLATGIPVWLSFRRCLRGLCGVYGQHWGGPEGDLFGRAARRFEEIGVDALMINCIPPDHVPGMLPWLRDFTDIPLGAYPNLGHLGSSGWKFDDRVGPKEFASLALGWRAEGARILGGCCGVTPEHIAAMRLALADPTSADVGPPPAVPAASFGTPDGTLDGLLGEEAPEVVEPWRDQKGRALFPLPFPELTCDPGVFMPTQGSLLSWRYLFRSGAGEGKSCLDVGCGCGPLAIQLALNGATRVHAIDIDRRAVANTLANAFRNGVSDRLTGAEVDIYTWEPDERYDLIVASLYQMPVDPAEEFGGHRPLDFWGRNLLDHFLALLPDLLTPEGTAYVMQLSILSEHETAAKLQKAGLRARVVDFQILPFGSIFQEHKEQIQRVEQLSDAYHLTIGDEDLLVAYVLEVERRPDA